MTREEKIKGLYSLKEYLVENPIEFEGHNKSLPITLIDYAIEALEQQPCETIKEIPQDYKYDTETEDFLVYRHIYTGHEIHIEKPVPRYRLEQEPFINKSCVSSGVCEHDKQKVLDKIRAEIEKLQKMCDKNDLNLMAQYSAFGMVLQILDKYKAESEGENDTDRT